MAESLLEKALKEYEAWEKELQKRNKEEAEKLAEKVEKWMRETFGDGFEVKPLHPGAALVIIDGVKFRAVKNRNSYYDEVFYLELKDVCPKCGFLLDVRYINDLKDLGSAYKRYLSFKKHVENCEGSEPPTKAERVLELLEELFVLIEEGIVR